MFPLAELESQQQRRCEGAPTLTVLAGAPGERVWTTWAACTRRPWVVVRIGTPRAISAKWLAELLPVERLRRAACGFLGLEPAALGTKSLAEMRLAVEHSSSTLARSASPVVALAQALVLEEASLGSDGLTVAALDTFLVSHADLRMPSSGWLVAVTLADLYAPAAVPCLLVSADGASPQEFDLIVRDLCRLVEMRPALAVGLSMESSLLAQYLSEIPESRSKAMLREGLVETESRAMKPLVAAERFPVEYEAARAAKARVKDAATLSARAEEGDGARSAAERLLFRALESAPDTVSLFVLNARLPFAFGAGPAETDFLAAGLGLALEIDGYHHFGTPAAYRRDRRKDLLLQQHGYLVIRFLADDVMERLDLVLEEIRAAVAVQRIRGVQPVGTRAE